VKQYEGMILMLSTLQCFDTAGYTSVSATSL